MKQVAMLFVTVATISWGASAAVERAPEPTPSAAVQIAHGSMIGWAVSKWDDDVGALAGGVMGTMIVPRLARDGYVVGGMLGGIVGALFGGALGGF